MKTTPAARVESLLLTDKFGKQTFPHIRTTMDDLGSRYSSFPVTCEFLRGNIAGNYNTEHPNFAKYATAWGWMISTGLREAITPLVGGGLTHETNGIGYTVFEAMHAYAQWLDDHGYAMILTPMRLPIVGEVIDDMTYADEGEGVRHFVVWWNDTLWDGFVMHKALLPLFSATLSRMHLYISRDAWSFATVQCASASGCQKFTAALVMPFTKTLEELTEQANSTLEQGATVEALVKFPVYGRNVYALNGTPAYFEMIGQVNAVASSMMGKTPEEKREAPSVIANKANAGEFLRSIPLDELVRATEQNFQIIPQNKLMEECEKEYTRSTMRVSLSLIDQIAGIQKEGK